MKATEYRKHIHKIVDKVHSERCLKQIYTVAHRLYLHEAAENSEEVHMTEKERLKRDINSILDGLDEGKLSEIYIFLYYYFGIGGIK